MSLQFNDISHWLGAYLDWSLWIAFWEFNVWSMFYHRGTIWTGKWLVYHSSTLKFQRLWRVTLKYIPISHVIAADDPSMWIKIQLWPRLYKVWLTHWGRMTYIYIYTLVIYPSLVQIMACRLASTKPLSEPVLTNISDAIWHHWATMS